MPYGMRRVLGLLGGAAVALIVSAAAQAADFDAVKYFKGKTITIVVDHKAGGGTDVQARFYAARLGKFIPGEPKLVVANIFPVPSGRNFTWSSKPDGFTLSAGSTVSSPEPETGEYGNKYFTQLGSHANRDVILMGRGTLPYKSLKESVGGKTTITTAEPVGSADMLDGKLLGLGLLAMWLDAPLKVLPVARSGTSDSFLLLERGDVNSYVAGGHWFALPSLRPGWLKDGFLKPLADLSHPDLPLNPNSEISMPIPNAVAWMTPEQRDIWNGIYVPDVVAGKGLIGPPDMPPEITKALRDAFANAMQDKQFSADLEKLQGQPVQITRGEKMQELMDASARDFAKYQPQYKGLQQQVYDRYWR
jgi:tripartite-type tricarboxylate transporter receptor subunit TctC